MTSERQIAANRLNARRSTGPRSESGKLRSRQNAVRHGLTAETVIGVLENPCEYAVFEAAIIADYAPRSLVEHELVVRLASLLWRLRRATSIETGLLEIQGEIQRSRKNVPETISSEPSVVHRLFDDGRITNFSEAHSEISIPNTSRDMTRCFLRLANLGNEIFERIGRYENSLWRQIAQTLLTLDAIRHQASSQ
jgi:hypothetical protein